MQNGTSEVATSEVTEKGHVYVLFRMVNLRNIFRNGSMSLVRLDLSLPDMYMYTYKCIHQIRSHAAIDFFFGVDRASASSFSLLSSC